MIIGMSVTGGSRIDVGRSLHTGFVDVAHVSKARHGKHFHTYAPCVTGKGVDFIQAFIDLVGKLGAV